MTHPHGWTTSDPCPSCTSWDILECEIRINGDEIRMGWECRDCGHTATWTTRPEADSGHAVERRIVAVMPLHAITTLYGERGLRERFADEVGRFTDAADRRKIKGALRLAGRLHALDHRQREPYVNHLLRVALRIICHYGVRDADMTCAALLHDAVEDHADDLSLDGRPGAFLMLAAGFGQHVAALMAAVTNPEHATDDRYRSHVAASLDRNPWARLGGVKW
jgi:HD domain